MSNSRSIAITSPRKTMLVEVVDSGEDITTRVRFLMEDEHDAASLSRQCKELDAARIPYVTFPTRKMFVEWRHLCDKGWNRVVRQTGRQSAA